MKIIDSKLQGNVLQEFTDDYLEKHKELIKYVKEETKKQFDIHGVGWRSEQLPEFDVQEINDILKDCKENKDNLITLIGMVWNKGYMEGVCYDAEND